MQEKPPKETPRRLDGWKEISKYLNRGITTIQRWEKEGSLPIHRISSQDIADWRKRSVYAIPSELDRWWEAERESIQADGNGNGAVIEPERAENQGGAENPPSNQRRLWFKSVRSRNVTFLSGILGLLALGIVSVWILVPSTAAPISARVENKTRLVVSGADGRFLWAKEFSRDIGCNYHGFRQTPVTDIDGDSVIEIIVGLYGKTLGNQDPDKVLCLDRGGLVRWEFVPGGKITWNAFVFPEAFKLWNYSIGSLARGQKFIVVIANHEVYSPSQVAILDAQGKIIGEYWHTGWIFDQLVMDLDGDGNDEVILGGVNDLHTKPFLAVIKYNTPRSISPVPKGFAPGFPMGKELAYYLIPRTDAAEALARNSRVHEIKRLDKNHITVGIQLPNSVSDVEERVYCLDLNFRTVALTFPDEFRGLHKRLRQEKRLDHDLLEADKKQLWQLERLLPESRSK